MKRLTVTIEGENDGDLEAALDDISQRVHVRDLSGGEGYISGDADNDTGAYKFIIEENVDTKQLDW